MIDSSRGFQHSFVSQMVQAGQLRICGNEQQI